MTLSVRDDDEPLLRTLAASTRLGTISRRAAYRTSNPQVLWQISAKSDCLRLRELLTKFPLRGRKANDFALWADAVRHWTSSNAGRWETRDWSQLSDLKRRLTAARAFDPKVKQIEHPARNARRGDWGPYFAGLLSAEGSLGILPNGPSNFLPTLHITLRADDRPLLEAVHAFTGVGRLYALPSRRWSPCVDWMVRDLPGLFRLIELLDENPPRGRKASEYAIWRDAVELHGSSQPRSAIRPALAKLRRALADARAYPLPRSA